MVTIERYNAIANHVPSHRCPPLPRARRSVSRLQLRALRRSDFEQSSRHATIKNEQPARPRRSCSDGRVVETCEGNLSDRPQAIGHSLQGWSHRKSHVFRGRGRHRGRYLRNDRHSAAACQRVLHRGEEASSQQRARRFYGRVDRER